MANRHRPRAVASRERHVPAIYEGKLEPNYYCRGWNGKRKKYCRTRAGAGTDHSGVGRCKHHGGSSPIVHGRYSQVRHPRVRDLIAEAETIRRRPLGRDR